MTKRLASRSVAVALAAALIPCSASAQISVAQTPTVAPDLGKIIPGSTSTTFTISADGTVTRKSGDAIRLSNSSVPMPTISINCALLNLVNLCALRYMQITVQPVGSSGPVKVNMFRIGSLEGATFRDGQPNAAGAISFVLNPMGLGTTTFRLGMDVSLEAGAASGRKLFGYTVTAGFLPG